MNLLKPLLQISNFIALISMILMNMLVSTRSIDGNTVGSVSDKYDTLFSPASYTFGIWGLIYLSLLGFVIYQGRDIFSKSKEQVPLLLKITGWFGLSCAANIVWLVAWLTERLGLALMMMAALLGSLLIIYIHLGIGNKRPRNPWERWLLHVPFSLYLGWISIAIIANVASYLVSIEWNGWGISFEVWTLFMIGLATILCMFMIMGRGDRIFGAVGIWALWGIGIKHLRMGIGESQLLMTTAVVCALLLVSSMFFRQIKASFA
ncbi:MAG: tryptophan-rich sensory protein [Bacteroidota bacterium]